MVVVSLFVCLSMGSLSSLVSQIWTLFGTACKTLSFLTWHIGCSLLHSHHLPPLPAPFSWNNIPALLHTAPTHTFTHLYLHYLPCMETGGLQVHVSVPACAPHLPLQTHFTFPGDSFLNFIHACFTHLPTHPKHTLPAAALPLTLSPPLFVFTTTLHFAFSALYAHCARTPPPVTWRWNERHATVSFCLYPHGVMVVRLPTVPVQFVSTPTHTHRPQLFPARSLNLPQFSFTYRAARFACVVFLPSILWSPCSGDVLLLPPLWD